MSNLSNLFFQHFYCAKVYTSWKLNFLTTSCNDKKVIKGIKVEFVFSRYVLKNTNPFNLILFHSFCTFPALTFHPIRGILTANGIGEKVPRSSVNIWCSQQLSISCVISLECTFVCYEFGKCRPCWWKTSTIL